MADILIRGMEMPDNLSDIRFGKDFHGNIIAINLGNRDGDGYYKRNEVIALPDHGDLIDIRTVLEIVMQYVPDDDGTCSKGDVDLRELLDDIENAPVIVPASEEETEKSRPREGGNGSEVSADC